MIPDLFDTHCEAAGELTPFARPQGTRKQDLAGMFHEELRLKACTFLATMYMEDEAYEEAEKVLAALLKSGGDHFYSRWAATQSKKIAKIQRGFS